VYSSENNQEIHEQIKRINTIQENEMVDVPKDQP